MVKYRWEIEDIDDCVIVTRLVDSGEEAEGGGSILKLSRISRPDAFAGLAEIRSSLDLLEKELKASEAEQKKQADAESKKTSQKK